MVQNKECVGKAKWKIGLDLCKQQTLHLQQAFIKFDKSCTILMSLLLILSQKDNVFQI